MARHLKLAHGITAKIYKVQYPGARIRSELCEANRSVSIAKARADRPMTGRKKAVFCPCGVTFEVGLTSASKDFRCTECRIRDKTRATEIYWTSKVEGADYVICQGCEHKAENLTSHIQNRHSEWIGCYSGQVVATSSAVRDKSALKGKVLSEEVKAKMAASAGWNRGLTKETDERVARAALGMRGRVPWSKGLTKADHPSLRSTAQKLSVWSGDKRNWSNGLKADLAIVDFTPYLDETGVDCKTMAEALGLCEPTITKYMEAIGLRLSTKYIDARVRKDLESGRFQEMGVKAAEKTRIVLTDEQLAPFKLKDGRVVIGKAMHGLGHRYAIISRECKRLSLPVRTLRISQELCLSAVSKVLGGANFQQEWKSWNFVNPTSGYRFMFDGYYPEHNLIVEFHGYQHWIFPSVYIRDRVLFEALVERDRVKKKPQF